MCVHGVAASHVALIEVLGCVEADHNREGREADRTIEQVATLGKQGKSFFFSLLSRSLSLSFFLFPLPDISINNVFRDRIFVFLQRCTRTVVLSADGENKMEATGKRAREK